VFELMGVWTSGALAGGTIAGIAFNFQTSRRLVFRSKGRIVCFVAIYTVGFALNWPALRAPRWYGVPALEARALLSLPIAAVSFIGQQALVFSQPSGQA
jgi:putative flippase GtrA